jgi:hypothetical protein
MFYDNRKFKKTGGYSAGLIDAATRTPMRGIHWLF